MDKVKLNCAQEEGGKIRFTATVTVPAGIPADVRVAKTAIKRRLADGFGSDGDLQVVFGQLVNMDMDTNALELSGEVCRVVV